MSQIILNSRVVKKDPPQLNLEKFADRAEAQGGDIYTYTIIVRNVSKQDAHDVSIDDEMDFDKLSVLDTDGGVLTDTGIQWNVPLLEAGKDLRLHYRVRLTENVTQGEIIPNNSVVRATDVDDLYASYDVRVITLMPQTGTMTAMLSESRFVRPLDTSAGASLMTIMATLLGLGFAAGNVFVKRWI